MVSLHYPLSAIRYTLSAIRNTNLHPERKSLSRASPRQLAMYEQRCSRRALSLLLDAYPTALKIVRYGRD